MKDLKLKAITALRALGNYLLVRRAILLIAEREQVHIVSGPNYLGVNGLSTQSVIPHESTMTLRFSTECRQQDANPVRRYVNRELILLCERHGIRIC
ncbi:MAG: hypothetical protein IJR62_03350 [Lachnospiraceae bacterium]|nr:hypothetical protein [Lachnospiraceae bacterium]